MILLIAGIVLAKGNNARKSLLVNTLSPKNDSTLNAIDSFKMPEFNAEAIRRQEEEYILSQMSQEELMAYQQYLQQMEYERQYAAALEKYNKEMNNRKPPVLDQKTESKIDKLKREFEEKRKRDSAARSQVLAPNIN